MSFGPVVYSYSSMKMFEDCAWRWYQEKIQKTTKFERSEAVREGEERHNALERALKFGEGLPAKYAGDAPIIESIRNTPGTKLCEWSFGLTRNWTETTFFAKDVWLRGKIDAGVIGTKAAALFDYKTGKVKDDFDQMSLFTIPAAVRWPSITKFKIAYLWLGTDKTTRRVYDSSEVPALKQKFAARIHRIETALASGSEERFPKQPSGLCTAWCNVPSRLCEYQQRDIP